jgi:hypothetical protein
MVVRARPSPRIEVRLPAYATPKQHRELGAFARYCIQRLERELGERETWIVDVTPSVTGHTSKVMVSDRGTNICDEGTGHDSTLAIWEAMCRVEQRLRDQRR